MDQPEENVLVCHRQALLRCPRVPSELDGCKVCDENVWRSAAAPKEYKAICMVCFLQINAPFDIMNLDQYPEALRSEIRNAGISDELAKEIIGKIVGKGQE